MSENSFFVTGAAGFIGRYLIAQLIQEKSCINVLTRTGRPEHISNKNIRIIKGDITNTIEVPDNVATIFHCAGAISNKNEMEKVNVSGTERIVEVALKRGFRLIHLSSAGVIGRTRQLVITEGTECNPQNLYEETKLKAEQIVMEGVRAGLKAQILRPTIVFGSGRNPETDSFLHLISAIKTGRYKHIDKGNGIYNIVHANEVVNAMLALTNENLLNGGVYFINYPVSFREFAEIVKNEVTGNNKVVSNIPYTVAFCAGAILSTVAAITGRKMPLTLSRVIALTNRKIFSQDRLMERTLYRPLLGIDQYIRRVCREYAEKGLLV